MESKIGFCAGTKVFEEALNAVKFLGWLKKFGPAQNILGPVKGQGISSRIHKPGFGCTLHQIREAKSLLTVLTYMYTVPFTMSS